MIRKQVFNSRSRRGFIGQLENSSKSCDHLVLVEEFAVEVAQTWVVVVEVHRRVGVVANRWVVEVECR